MTIHILFVDDEPEFIGAHITALEAAGFTVKQVESYEDALLALQKQSFDLIILDLILARSEPFAGNEETWPDEGIGLDLHRRIREELDLTNVPILFFTIVNERATIEKIQRVESGVKGKSRILHKPGLPSKLLDRVRGLIGEGREKDN